MSSFHFDHVVLKPEEQIGRHSQPTWELDYIIRGRGIKEIGNAAPMPFQEGEVVLLHPNIEHVWHFDHLPTIENITVTFTDEWLANVVSDFPEIQMIRDSLLRLPVVVTLKGQMHSKVADYLKSMITQSSQMRLLTLFQIMLLISESDDYQTIATSANETLTEQRIRQMDIFIRCNFARSITLDDIATHVGMNQSSLCSLCKRVTGQTITQRLTAVRITQAQHLLSSTDRSIKEICYAVGYNDLPHFSRVFRREVGVSPKEYRSTYPVPASSVSPR